MKIIPLTQGKVAFVDDADFDWLSQWKWHAKRGPHTWYATRRERGRKRRRVERDARQTIRMHSVLLPPSPGTEVDHADGNGLNNQHSNLRLATRQQNKMNTNHKALGKSSRFKGVYWNKGMDMWQSGIRVGSLRSDKRSAVMHLGSFRDEVEAATAYNRAAVEHFGAFASINVLP